MTFKKLRKQKLTSRWGLWALPVIATACLGGANAIQGVESNSDMDLLSTDSSVKTFINPVEALEPINVGSSGDDSNNFNDLYSLKKFDQNALFLVEKKVRSVVENIAQNKFEQLGPKFIWHFFDASTLIDLLERHPDQVKAMDFRTWIAMANQVQAIQTGLKKKQFGDWGFVMKSIPFPKPDDFVEQMHDIVIREKAPFYCDLRRAILNNDVNSIDELIEQVNYDQLFRVFWEGSFYGRMEAVLHMLNHPKVDAMFEAWNYSVKNLPHHAYGKRHDLMLPFIGHGIKDDFMHAYALTRTILDTLIQGHALLAWELLSSPLAEKTLGFDSKVKCAEKIAQANLELDDDPRAMSFWQSLADQSLASNRLETVIESAPEKLAMMLWEQWKKEQDDMNEQFRQIESVLPKNDAYLIEEKKKNESRSIILKRKSKDIMHGIICNNRLRVPEGYKKNLLTVLSELPHVESHDIYTNLFSWLLKEKRIDATLQYLEEPVVRNKMVPEEWGLFVFMILRESEKPRSRPPSLESLNPLMHKIFHTEYLNNMVTARDLISAFRRCSSWCIFDVVRFKEMLQSPFFHSRVNHELVENFLKESIKEHRKSKEYNKLIVVELLLQSPHILFIQDKELIDEAFNELSKWKTQGEIDAMRQ